MQSATPYLSYILGALGGGGVILAWYGLQRVRKDDGDKAFRRSGLIMVNAGIIMAAVSFYFIATTK
jgi:tetrahydromethanopterin S-methyltransferase subunit D